MRCENLVVDLNVVIEERHVKDVFMRAFNDILSSLPWMDSYVSLSQSICYSGTSTCWSITRKITDGRFYKCIIWEIDNKVR